MEQPTVEEFALCAVVPLFSAALAPVSLPDSIAVYIMYYTSRSNSAACKQNNLASYALALMQGLPEVPPAKYFFSTGLIQ